jgi:hypothetical protein
VEDRLKHKLPMRIITVEQAKLQSADDVESEPDMEERSGS